MTLTHFFNMIAISGESLLILTVTAVTCALIGCFLVLRKLSMISDAISHSVLLGIVLAFFIAKNIHSPLLIIGATLFGLLTVFAVETLSRSGLVKNDDAVGIVFPLFFSVAVILITRFARNARLSTDTVIMGEIIMAPLFRMDVFGYSLPKSLVAMSVVLLLNLLFIYIFFKELKLTTFDPQFAAMAGFSSTMLFYALMTLSSLTSVVAFDAVGAILVISFLVTPATSAYLISKDLKTMLLLACAYAIVNCLIGYLLALYFSVSMAGMVSVIAGITFFLTFLFNKEGFITSMLLRRRKKHALKLDLMLIHIGNHMGTSEEKEELGGKLMKNHLKWSQAEIRKRAEELIKCGLVYQKSDDNTYQLTESGIKRYRALKNDFGT